MTEHERIQAEYKAWAKETSALFANLPAAFEAGWLAAKADTQRLQQEFEVAKAAAFAADALNRKPIPTFDEWFWNKHACGFDMSVYCRKGLPYDSVMRLLSEHLREYVSEMIQRR